MIIMYYENLEPKDVLYWFEKICEIPHGSKNTKRISDFCVSFASERNLYCKQDKLNNVIIKKPATKGYEISEPVILQGHLDMVCEKKPDCNINFLEDGLKLCCDGEYIYADGTTLGGDDGIAVAMILALLNSGSIPHPEIEAVLTVDEEIGMLGAEYIDLSGIKSKTLINIDSEVESVFTVGCAGGNITKITLPTQREKYAGKISTVEISGLLGGHSGIEIDKGRANSNILISRLLNDISNIRIISINGGQKDNAIPNYSKAVIIADEQEVNSAVTKYQQIFSDEYTKTDNDITVSVSHGIISGCDTMNKNSTKRLLELLNSLPNGIVAMSNEIKGLTETSLNMGILKSEENRVNISFCVRSAKGIEKQKLVDRIKELSSNYGANVEVFGDYPAWEYNPTSYIRELMSEVFVEQYGKEPKIETVHAGLECGLFCGKIRDLDCISIGPDLLDIHTPNEKMSIKSVERTWKLLLETLKRMK